MELVINIPEGYYKAIKKIPVEQCTSDMLIIQNGTPLPKGGGRMRFRDIKNKIHELVENAYVMGYEDGLKDGKESVQIDETEAYKLGLETAWELARKLSNLGFNDTRKEIFGEKYGLSIDIIKDFSVDEVADKIKEYEEKQKQKVRIRNDKRRSDSQTEMFIL
jgi:hypothetical protein